MFRTNGQNYHKSGTLLPLEGQRLKFAQLYIYNTQNKISNRMHALGGNNRKSILDLDIISRLIAIFIEYNELAKAFRIACGGFTEDDFLHV